MCLVRDLLKNNMGYRGVHCNFDVLLNSYQCVFDVWRTVEQISVRKHVIVIVLAMCCMTDVGCVWVFAVCVCAFF